MSSPRKNIPDAVRDAQARASNPDVSAFVAANAGSGKTHVLVNRVIRLLLNGVPPERILCITFTKAAAANMAQRVFETLGRWVTLPERELDEAIRAVGAPAATAQTRLRARKLFASALETPGGLKVQTIHALCTRLLQQFPFEANVPARFSVLDDRDQNEMMERANLAVLLEAAQSPESDAGWALNIAMSAAADVTFKDVVREACLSRDHFVKWSDTVKTRERAHAALSQALGIGEADASDALVAEISRHSLSLEDCGALIARLMETGNNIDNAQAARLSAAMQSGWPDAVDDYAEFFLKDDGAAKEDRYLLSKGLRDDFPALMTLARNERDRVAPLIARLRATRARDRALALFVIATAAANNYRREKQERGLLDYDDLIDKTYEMLTSVSSGWVHFKLDRGIDHVLIDEAQDTSPRQWDIIDCLTAEFTTGAGARDGVKRTIFAVGDEKQSIFSFQGAMPREFDHRRRDIKERFEAAGLRFDPVSFTYSFRSGEGVLQAVTSTFKDSGIYKSVTTDLDGMPPHMALQDAAPAQIDLWEIEVPDTQEDIEGWSAAFDHIAETSPEVRLARRVQTEIRSLIAARTLTGPRDKRRPLRYGDLLVLVRRRGRAFDAIIQALKHAGIPVAGADRLKLTEHIAVIDLMNLADALLLPRDDLALAVALKSPLFGLDDDHLLSLAPDRAGSLRDALAAHAATDEKIATALDRLKRYEQRFAQETPFSFYAWLLGADRGRARILARLGPEADDALDEFLELALTYERKGPASLQGFMAWLRAADTEVKRDMEIARDEVRVMTVHGSKGLEAPVVFVVDTTTSPADTQRTNLIRLQAQGNAAPHAPAIVLWAGKKAFDLPMVATARDAMKNDTEDEYRRLLYVAMTRAADRLIVGGVLPGNMRAVRKLSWYDLIQKGLADPESGLQCEIIATGFGPVKRYARPQDVEPQGESAAPVQEMLALQQFPGWLRTPAPKEGPADILLRPSDSSPGEGEGHRIITDETRAARKRALKRGTLIHRLLQSLPDVAGERREKAALDFLRRNAEPLFSEEECIALARQVIALIETPAFAPVFGQGSRAEVSVAGRVPRAGRPPALVSGQIDRLVVTPNEVLIVDYKTNHAPPAAVADAPQAYVRQLALYRDVLRRLYPGHDVRCLLLWTETAALMEIPASALDAELQSLVS
ncbi:double-strand break repair helicase AddA [Afipia clevelandensis]|uniref:DNA 3'-5' helicase n=1 Tax=Afipia clevelandensis ATCC 49720 TaxID=883079 RepID=K8P0F5_9BRAD|nr:double-strand break repair helicase AddA [Afipia clevelandensis]EKS33150.1 double-strand break repair helicase AddA [Afipia clevelandensis ATCC 49720]